VLGEWIAGAGVVQRQPSSVSTSESTSRRAIASPREISVLVVVGGVLRKRSGTDILASPLVRHLGVRPGGE
jgi:hypothetical protein